MIKKGSKSLCGRGTKDSVLSFIENARTRRSTVNVSVRGKSLVDYRNIPSRVPRFSYSTQDCKFWNKTTQVTKSTTDTRLSPYTPLPAIGTRINTLESKDDKSGGDTAPSPPKAQSHDLSSGSVIYGTNFLESKAGTNLGGTPLPILEGRNIVSIGSPSSTTKNDTDTSQPPDTTVNIRLPVRRLIREHTYVVLEPKFVKRPTPLPQSPNTELQKPRKRWEISRKKNSSEAKVDDRKFKDSFKEPVDTVLLGALHHVDGDQEESESATSTPLEAPEDNVNFNSTDKTLFAEETPVFHAVSNIATPTKTCTHQIYWLY